MDTQTIRQSKTELFVIAFRTMPQDVQQSILDELTGADHAGAENAAHDAAAQNEPAIRLLRTWLADDSGYDEGAWPTIRRTLDDNRLSGRRLFHA